MRLSRLLIAAVALAATVAFAAPAKASQLIDRNASVVSLKVNSKGEALVTYRAGGAVKRVLAWGAINAIAPTTARAQVKFSLDYAGGWGKYHRNYATAFHGNCGRYDGSPLAWLVVACKAPDGSYWALQSWQKMLANYGGKSAPWELHLSHWTGSLPFLEMHVNWAYRHYRHLFGRFTYNGVPVHGFRATPGGNPLDTFGRNIYVDVLNSPALGAGWRRENSFLTHKTGVMCYGFYPHGHGEAFGEQYRATVIGPGVTPDVMWQGTDPGNWDKNDPAKVQLQTDMNTLLASWHDRQCHPV
jgi:hypothetical protein